VAGAIKFSASVSVCGRYALQGGQVLAGLRAWVEAVNAGGGLQAHGIGARGPFRLVHYDDASRPPGPRQTPSGCSTGTRWRS
jgi:ABC-type branched-subunit amino acid transport system substrate-binding protein